jgi:hypothetical protein
LGAPNQELTDAIVDEAIDIAGIVKGAIKEVIVNPNYTTIGNYAFSGCDNLESINLAVDLTSIGNYAFSGCINLESINLPADLTSIGNSAFIDCSSLSSIDLPSGLTSIGNSAFGNCSSLSSIDLSTTGLTSIENGTFA